ncbi:MAG TPA: DMT family transporter [Acidimicrobiales bacterium]|nr:DMT family transporter [Acidimicrobiales bacterium]
MTRRAWGLFAAMTVLWGVPYLLIKVADRSFAPPALVLARTGLAAVLLVPVALARGELLPVLRRWRPLLAYTVAELAVPWVLLADAERRLPSSLAGLLVAAVPLVAAVVAAARGVERPGRAQLLGLLVGFGGVAVLAGVHVHGAGWRAVAEMAVVAVGYAVGPAVLAARMRDLPGMGVVAASLGLTALAYLPWGLATWPGRVPPARVLASVAVLAVVCTAVAFLVFFALIGEAGPVRPMVFTYVNPVVAVALGVAFLHEGAGPATLGGAVLVLAGSLLATGRVTRRRAERGPGRRAERRPGGSAAGVAALEGGYEPS